MRIVASPFADFCNVSFPLVDGESRDIYAAAEADFLEVAFAAGATIARTGLLHLGARGTLKYGRRYGVGFLGLSGGALAALRSCRLLGDLLASVGCWPHRVTTLHVALDVEEDTPSVLRRLWRRAVANKLKLSRKAVPAVQVRRMSRTCYVSGRLTGTLYLGNRRRDVSAKVYDKRNQLIDVATGDAQRELLLSPPPPLTRYELQLGRHVGVTVADVDDPRGVFWHYAGGALLRRPETTPAWVPGSEGYVMAKRPEVDYMRQLNLLLEHSGDIQRAVMLADRISPTKGRALLSQKLQGYVLPGSGLGKASPAEQGT